MFESKVEGGELRLRESNNGGHGIFEAQRGGSWWVVLVLGSDVYGGLGRAAIGLESRWFHGDNVGVAMVMVVVREGNNEHRKGV